MPVRNAVPADLEPIERASRDEVQSLQLERLKWSLQHAYHNVPHYRRVFDQAKVHPSHLKQLLHVMDVAAAERKTATGPIFHDLAERLKKRGIVVILSDLFKDQSGGQ